MYAGPGEPKEGEFLFRTLKEPEVDDPVRMQKVRDLGYTVLRGIPREGVAYRWMTMQGEERKCFWDKYAIWHRGTATIRLEDRFYIDTFYIVQVTTYDKLAGMPYPDQLSIHAVPHRQTAEFKKNKSRWFVGCDRDLTGKVDEGNQQRFDAAVDLLLRFFQTDNR